MLSGGQRRADALCRAQRGVGGGGRGLQMLSAWGQSAGQSAVQSATHEPEGGGGGEGGRGRMHRREGRAADALCRSQRDTGVEVLSARHMVTDAHHVT